MLRRKASRGDINASDDLSYATRSFPEELSFPNSKIKDLTGVTDQEWQAQQQQPQQQSTVTPTTTSTTSKKQRIRKLTGGSGLSSKEKAHKADQNIQQPPISSLGSTNSFTHSNRLMSANQGEVITLDTNLDEMDGIINRDHAAMQVRRTSSFSGAPSFFGSPSHLNNSEIQGVGGGTVFADPFNPGRTLGSPNCVPRNTGFHEPGAGSNTGPTDSSVHHYPSLPRSHRSIRSLGGSSSRDFIPVDSRRRESQNSQKSLTGMSLHANLNDPDFGPPAHATNRSLFPATTLAQSSPSRKPPAHHYGGGLNQVGPNPTPVATTGLGIGAAMVSAVNGTISAFGAGKSVSNAPSLNSLAGANTAAGWTAPESWAVNPMDGNDSADTDVDGSEEEDGLVVSDFYPPHPDNHDGPSDPGGAPSGAGRYAFQTNGSFSGVSGTTVFSQTGTSFSGSLYSSTTIGSSGANTALMIPPINRLGSIDESVKSTGFGTPVMNGANASSSRRPSEAGGMSIMDGSEGSGHGCRPTPGSNVSGSTVNGKMGGATRAGPADGSKSWTIRISRADGSFATLSCPLMYTAAEICHQLGRKLFNQKPPAGYKLYMKERGLERVIAPNEKPLVFQRRRLEQAGYTMLDRLDDVGRLDYSYLMKFLYKEESLTVVATDEDFHEHYEFVDLQARSIQAIPIVLFNHAALLISLNLSKNPKLDIPLDFIQLCTSLQELKLCHMAMKRVQPSIRQCHSLMRLDISNNRIVDLEHARLDDLPELMALRAHNNRLWTLPDYFRDFRSLSLLNISNNKFESLPSVICEIKSLVDLDISFNMINSLPNEIGQLANLQRFVFLANPISTIPSTFSGLSELRELDCRRCLLGDIAIFSDLPHLKKLLCENNAATILDGRFNSLQELNAGHNSITRLLLVGTGATLVSLNVSYAKISSLGQEFFDALVSCESLNLDSNQIKSFSDSFSQLTNLRNFSMKNNQLTSLPDSLGQLQRLHTLNLANNNLGSLPRTIWNCSQLIVLNASSNLIQEFPMPPAASANDPPGQNADDHKPQVKPSLPNLKPSNGSSSAHNRSLPPLARSLQELFMGDNGLGDNVFGPISLLSELRVLNLSFNELYEIPPLTLSKCESLEELYLSGNSLTSLPGEDIENLSNLKTFFLNGNKLQTLPAELGKLKHLESLDVSSNLLKYNVTNWPYDWNWNWNLDLQYLNLSGNKRLEIKPAAGAQQDAVAAAKRKNLSNFNALRRLRVLGLMDVTLTTPSVPDESEDRRVRVTQSEVSSMGYGIADSMGREDYTVVGLDMVVSRFRNKDDESLFGLFDAHSKTPFGGGKLAKFLHDSFSTTLAGELRRLKENESVTEALRRAFLNTNRDYGNMVTSQFETRRKGSNVGLQRSDRPSITAANCGVDAKCGASAVVMYVAKKTIYVANVGDALAVVAKRGGVALPLTHKHDPFDATEIERIRSAEAWVSQKGLVEDEVEVSRSFGYFHVHPAINARPSIQTLDLSEDDEFIIIANAGLWSHMTYQAAVDVARAQNKKADPMGAAQKLRDLALSYGAESNLMVMVIALGDLFKAKRRLTYRGAGGAHIDEELYGATRVATRRGQMLDAPGEKYLTLLDREVAPPTGMVALVFTDIRNSTSLWETNPGMQSAMRMHNQLLRRQLRAIGGYEVKTEGDAFMVSFPSVTSALLWCFTVQLELLREDWPQEILDAEDGKEIYDSNGMLCYRGLSVRMGIHWGNPHCEADPITRRMDYFGPMVNRTARISGEAKGGEITASLDVIEIVKTLCFDQNDGKEGNDPLAQESDAILDPATRRDVASIRKMGFGVSEIGEKRLKGLEMPEFISLIYPRSLAGRLNNQGASLGGPDSKVDEVYEPTPRMLDVNHIKQLVTLVVRLEAVSAAAVHAPLSFSPSSASTTNKLTGSNVDVSGEERAATIGNSNKRPKSKLLNGHLLTYPIRSESTDEELAAILENQVIRIENVLSSLELRSLGPIYDVLLALGDAVKVQPNVLLHALEAFGLASNAAGLF